MVPLWDKGLVVVIMSAVVRISRQEEARRLRDGYRSSGYWSEFGSRLACRQVGVFAGKCRRGGSMELHRSAGIPCIDGVDLGN